MSLIKADSIIDLVIQLDQMNKKPQLVSDEVVDAKVKEIYGKPEYIEKQKQRKAELNNLINDLLKTLQKGVKHMNKESTYYLTITAKRKNAKRHITEKSKDLNILRQLAKNINDSYIVSIYDGSWNLVEQIK